MYKIKSLIIPEVSTICHSTLSRFRDTSDMVLAASAVVVVEVDMKFSHSGSNL